MFRYLALISLIFTLIEGGQKWHTSQLVLMQLYDLQKEHFNVIDEYLNLESERLNKLKNNLHMINEWLEKKVTSIDTQFHNHIQAIQTVAQIRLQLSTIEHFTNNKQSLEVLEKIDEDKDLSGDHINLAFQAIRRLQRFYAIPSSDMAKGRYNDRIIGDEMNACDSYVMSKYCFEDGDVYCALEWAIQVYNKWTDGDRPDCVSIENVINYIILSSSYTGFNLSSLFNLNTLHYEESTNNFMKYYSLMKDELIDPINSVTLEVINPYDFFEVFDNEAKFKELCRNGKPLKTLTKYSKCRYQTKNSVYRILMPFKEEDVNLDPDVKIYHDVLYDDEIIKIISMAKDEMIDAKIKGFGGSTISKETSRLGQAGWLSKEQGTSELASLNARIESFTGLTTKTAEQYQIVNYGLGGHYVPHEDGFDRGLEETKVNGNRLATALFYLTDIPNDGFTSFPLLDIVSPVEKGAVLLWYNLHLSNGSINLETRHGSCPLLKGNKWIMTKWIYEEGQNLPYDWRNL